ncbi:hypothetical protein N7462_002787 [Penicillium macrosclerotiorum]|uniref:uncharacterized protein n=1 Tax=Penicillium macrosclerotiorum TaxID=303699 RepID=UPI002547273C|nr:uncharacterized protein N7462_002787 [Penicillium macrosclerotiorum]KAJ5693364.1 hypothetical protein N7462_002787 [Penicillium macrosclerotiorum]
MSTQSPHPPTPKGSRSLNISNGNSNSRRPPKKPTTPHVPKSAMLSTPPSSPPRNMSPAGVTTDSSANIHSKKKPPRSGKKPRNTNGASPAPNNGHRHTNSHPSTTPQAKDAAYAGPTFHASPAPSALPMPSFFSKSVPESDLAPTLETDSDVAEGEADLEITPSKPRASRPLPADNEAQPSPLDFLFQAAKQARTSNPMSSPEATSRVRSPQTDSKIFPPHPTNTPGGMFAFEMDSPDSARASPVGPSFAPSYQDRMNALRSSSSPSQSPSLPPDATEDQRRFKTEQLKHLLLNPRPQKPPSSVSSPPEQNGNYGVARTGLDANLPHYATPMRTSSGPPITHLQGYSAGQQQPMPNNAGRPPFPYSHANGIQQFRNTNSPLRREVPGTNGYYSGYPSGHSSPSPYGNNSYTAPSPARLPQAGIVSPQPQYTQAAFAMPPNSPSPSKSMETKKMEDDLRRILKLDAAAPSPAPGIAPNGMQSSFAA